MATSLIGQYIPALTNYRGSDYKAHHQNWAITQGENQVMYFGNTDGLLSFNGNEWNLHKLKTNKIIRSLCRVGHKIYSGAYGDFGYWLADECGALTYHSLIHLIPNQAIEKEEIWHIIDYKGKVYFQSFSALLVYDGQKILRIEVPGSMMFLHPTNDRLILPTLYDGLFEVDKNLGLVALANTKFFEGKVITGIAPIDTQTDGLHFLITTNSYGVYEYHDGIISPWNASLQPYFTEVQINKCLRTHGDKVILGTIRDGILIFDIQGTLLYHVHTTNGLQNNTVLSIYEDLGGDLWVGLDKGIGHLEMDDNILYYNDHTGSLGSVYSIARDGKFLYIGTNQGVYYNEESNKGQLRNEDYMLMNGTQGQVWELKKTKTGILCGHNEGTFQINGTKATKISDVTGGWYTKEVMLGEEEVLIQGSYTGLCLFVSNNGKWVFSHKITGYSEPVKKFVRDLSGKFWVCGPNTGITCLTLDANMNKVVASKNYSGQMDNPKSIQTELHDFRGHLIGFDGESYYRYNEEKDIFSKDEYLNQFSKGFLLRTVYDTTWMRIYADSAIVMNGKQAANKYIIAMNKDYHNVAMIDPQTIGISLQEGFCLVDSRISAMRNGHGNIQKPIKIYKKETLPSGDCQVLSGLKEILIPYTENSFRIYFYDLHFSPNKYYWYRLLPSDEQWRSLTNSAFITFNNLNPGQYTLEIKNQDGNISQVDLEVGRPWYQGNIAIVIYLLLIGTFLFLLKKYFDTKLRIEKSKIAEENARALHQRLIEIENDRLTQANIQKSKELANATLHLIQKNELLQEIKSEIIDIRKTGDQKITGKDFQTIMKQINQNITVQQDKNLFDASFEEVHEQLFKHLKKDFPELTQADLKLAAYLKMNLTSKEIAPLFNISLRGLENKRYRLRKKLGLPVDTNLTEYFNGLDI
ncbi:MAG: triple tyrosine motif-containing protein [Saprospiraceae bacterium]